MKKITTILLVLFATVSVAQDSELFGYINEYRVSNGKKAVKWSEELSVISKCQSDTIVAVDSIFHSGTDTYECVAKSSNIAATPENVMKFQVFLRRYFNMQYADPKGDDFDVSKYSNLYVVFLFSKSPSHNAILLRDDITIGSACMSMSDVSFKSNVVVIQGKIYTFSKVVSHYEVDLVGVVNFR